MMADRIRRALIACLLGGAVLSFESAASAQDAGRVLSMTSIRNQCVEFSEVKLGTGPVDYRECRVSEFGEVGAVGNQIYYYAIYCLMPAQPMGKETCGDDSFAARYQAARGMAVFSAEPASGTARLVFERADIEIGTVYYRTPEIIQSASGTLLHLPIVLDGTGVGNLSEYYLREASRWEQIEAESWLDDLQKRLPAGLAIWKGIWPDLRTMQAEAGLYRSSDTNCCPTGGVARIQLAIRARRLVLVSVVVGPPPQ